MGPRPSGPVCTGAGRGLVRFPFDLAVKCSVGRRERGEEAPEELSLEASGLRDGGPGFCHWEK